MTAAWMVTLPGAVFSLLVAGTVAFVAAVAWVIVDEARYRKAEKQARKDRSR